MATSPIQTKSSKSPKETSTLICTECSKGFCFDHDIQNDFNQFKQTIIEQKNHPEKRLAIEKINQWEINSIEKIKQTAKECR